MIRIWANINRDGKIVKDFVYENQKNMVYSQFIDHLIDICYALDAPTPILIKQHIFSYAKYNVVKFLPSDFAETVDFDKMVLENINK